MATTYSERVNQLIEHFMEDHNQGLSVSEIADKHKVSTRTVYSHLNEIAKRNNRTREYLLQVPHKEHSSHSTTHKNIEKKKKIRSDFEDILTASRDLAKQLDHILREEI